VLVTLFGLLEMMVVLDGEGKIIFVGSEAVTWVVSMVEREALKVESLVWNVTIIWQDHE
jgi:hypothetical protein